MSRAFVIINNSGHNSSRSRAIDWVVKAPLGTRVEFKGPKRTLPQNDRMWAMLTDIATQKEHFGRRYTPDQWKAIFMSASGCECQFIPALDGCGFVPWGLNSSDLSKEEMSDLIAFMEAWGTQNSVVFHDKTEVEE
jgi:hypothetical protein